MKFLKRAFPFILLNIAISAVTTLAVLFWWNNTHPLNLPQIDPADMVPTSAPQIQPTVSLPSLDTPLVAIDSVIAPGDLANEAVILKLAGSQEVLLNGWILAGSGGSRYTLPNLLLKSGDIQLFSSSKPADRPESAGVLYWDRSQPAWRSGETLTLIDPLGGVRATYEIP